MILGGGSTVREGKALEGDEFRRREIKDFASASAAQHYGRAAGCANRETSSSPTQIGINGKAAARCAVGAGGNFNYASLGHRVQRILKRRRICDLNNWRGTRCVGDCEGRADKKRAKNISMGNRE